MRVYTTLVSRYRVAENPLLSERRVELLALVLTLVFILILLFSVVGLLVSAHPPAKLPSADSLVGTELRRSGVVSAQHSNEMRARPVFWPSRLPVDAPLAVVEEPKSNVKKSALDKVKLLGIFGVGDSTGIIALVEGKKKRILLGDKVVGWSLDSIDRNEAVFVAGGQTQKLTLKYTLTGVTEVAQSTADTSAKVVVKPDPNRTLTMGGRSPNNEKTKR